MHAARRCHGASLPPSLPLSLFLSFSPSVPPSLRPSLSLFFFLSLPLSLTDPWGGLFRYDIRAVALGDPTLSVCEIWGAEYQENNAVLLRPEDVLRFEALASREQCPVSVVGEVTGDGKVTVVDSADGSTPVDLPLELVLGDLPPKVTLA